MERPHFSPAVVMIGAAEAAESRRQGRVGDTLREIVDTGTSGEYGRFIETWESLAVKYRTDEGLKLGEREALDRIRTHMSSTFGEPGIVDILRAWYDPMVVRKREVARETQAAHARAIETWQATGD